jgi:NAD(P)-dependent dehydrogenase (short-subunit alcohol dehydrogenase family)
MASSHLGTALITGGTRGIGLAAAQLFASQGYRVVVAGRDRTRLDAALETLYAASPSSQATPQEHRAVMCDVSSDTDVQALAKVCQCVSDKATIESSNYR